ncbi:nucleotidyl transferase AbiEii/AbiGii toxin family protein [bacterium]|nr:nucleotidyl transferase AbiEii/AbiGii toxin family protein [bacterium]
MKEYIRKIIGSEQDPVRARNRVREYVQARILHGIQEGGGMMPLAFHGGTALRILFDLPRYSEDLDFSLERPEYPFDFRKLIRSIVAEFQGEGYEIGTRIHDRKAVHSTFIDFPFLFQELGLAGSNLSVKIEVDTRPPAGARLSETIVRRHLILRIQHHDRASLLAGKLNALFTRRYTKGRDLYDLFWYLSAPGWPDPNMELLNHAMMQFEGMKQQVTAQKWRSAILQHAEKWHWDRIVSDVRPFLENSGEADMLTLKNLEKLLG